MTLHGIHIPEDRVAELCRRHCMRRLAFFGSILRDDFSRESDIDLLVEFEPSQPVGLLRLTAIELELGDLLGRKVDLNTVGSLSPYFRDEVLREARTLYVAA
jgi:predicted nucleotidyltransferase